MGSSGSDGVLRLHCVDAHVLSWVGCVLCRAAGSVWSVLCSLLLTDEHVKKTCWRLCQEYLYFELDQHAHHARGKRVMKGLLLCSCLSPPRLGEIVEIRLRTRFVVGVVLSDNR